jgi:hypothetical protein
MTSEENKTNTLLKYLHSDLNSVDYNIDENIIFEYLETESNPFFIRFWLEYLGTSLLSESVYCSHLSELNIDPENNKLISESNNNKIERLNDVYYESPNRSFYNAFHEINRVMSTDLKTISVMNYYTFKSIEHYVRERIATHLYVFKKQDTNSTKNTPVEMFSHLPNSELLINAYNHGNEFLVSVEKLDRIIHLLNKNNISNNELQKEKNYIKNLFAKFKDSIAYIEQEQFDEWSELIKH